MTLSEKFGTVLKYLYEFSNHFIFVVKYQNRASENFSYYICFNIATHISEYLIYEYNETIN
jgi:hypothetical protein